MVKLKNYLIKHGIKQSFVAKKIGLSDRQMSYLINEATSIKTDILKKISKVLDCKVEDIIDVNVKK
jgi:DNA-binding Xre family transcriptional regulator